LTPKIDSVRTFKVKDFKKKNVGGGEGIVANTPFTKEVQTT